MKRLMLDHFRRWWWVLATVAILEFGLGWFIAAPPKSPFEFWAFLLALWTGATLLSFDLKHGLLRVLGSLPLAPRQIGRGWWLATVPIPAFVLAVLMFMGAGTFCYFHPNQAFPARLLAVGSLFNLVWLGISFTLVFNATRGFYGSSWEFFGNSFISILSIMAFFGSMMFAQDASKSLIKSAILFGVGAVLTGVGWLRAEQFDLSRAGIYLGRAGKFDLGRPGQSAPGSRLTPLKPRIQPGRYSAPDGFGGIPFLIRTSLARGFFHIVAMVALMALLLHWQGRGISRPQDIVLFVAMGSFMSCWFIVFYQLLPALQHLRCLRTLPISANCLAVVMIALTILPLGALGALLAGVAGLALGTPTALTVLSSYTFILAPAALCAFFAVWQGSGKPVYITLLLTLFGFFMGGVWLQGYLHVLEMPFGLAGPIAAIIILLAFLLTRRALLHSSRAYRV